MEQRIDEVLEELHRFGVEHDATKVDQLQRYRNVEPETAQLLAVLVRATGAQKVLELGTSDGYSTFWLAEAARATSGSVTTADIDAVRSSQAAGNLHRAGLADRVDLIVGDAGDLLAGSADEAWDLIFLDAERPAYVSYWRDLLRVLVPGGLLVVDNVISHAEQVRYFRALISADPGVRDSLVPTGAGALLVVRNP